ncbi:hypothetical protein D8674_037497 [Pyrus ussuriensis x Pyrus communis]|uniref:Uncharacterized protein n=1 Tax=Pyrus ussuriensis x Pyrus communis TaxID=2448454 RepID=A0A5N5GXW8_9ROSA|nr:hypothetical protein D8674_037497 [Pyrus ussuriensis x Pyrus communis]
MPRFVMVSTRIFKNSSEFSHVFATIPVKIGVEVGLKLFLKLAHSYGCFKQYEMLSDIWKVFKEPQVGLSGLAKHCDWDDYDHVSTKHASSPCLCINKLKILFHMYQFIIVIEFLLEISMRKFIYEELCN